MSYEKSKPIPIQGVPPKTGTKEYGWLTPEERINSKEYWACTEKNNMHTRYQFLKLKQETTLHSQKQQQQSTQPINKPFGENFLRVVPLVQNKKNQNTNSNKRENLLELLLNNVSPTKIMRAYNNTSNQTIISDIKKSHIDNYLDNMLKTIDQETNSDNYEKHIKLLKKCAEHQLFNQHRNNDLFKTGGYKKIITKIAEIETKYKDKTEQEIELLKKLQEIF